MADTGDNGLSPAAIAELKQKHGDRLSTVEGPDGTTWVVQRPPKGVWALFQQAAVDEKDRNVMLDTLALDCVVYPDRARVASALDEYPAYSASLSNVLGELAGQKSDLNAKKL